MAKDWNVNRFYDSVGDETPEGNTFTCPNGHTLAKSYSGTACPHCFAWLGNVRYPAPKPTRVRAGLWR